MDKKLDKLCVWSVLDGDNPTLRHGRRYRRTINKLVLYQIMETITVMTSIGIIIFSFKILNHDLFIQVSS